MDHETDSPKPVGQAGELTYGLPHEMYYAEPNTPREMWVSYKSDDTTVQFELVFEEHDFNRDRWNPHTAIRLKMFADAWKAWAATPDLFSMLAAKEPASLEQVRAILDALDATDATARVHPGKHGPALTAMRAFRETPSPDNAQAAADALLKFAGDPDEEVPF